MIELRHLRYLVGVADAGSIVSAAEHLRVAQPALSRQLRDLQSELQAQLFEPGARKATFTPAGAVGAELARGVIEDAERAIARTRLSEAGLAGRCVVVSGPIGVLSGLLASLLLRVRAAFPDIELVLREAGGREQWDAIARGHADIGIGVPPARQFSTLTHELQHADVADVALISPDHPLAKRKEVDIEELLDLPLIALRNMDSEPDRVKELLAANTTLGSSARVLRPALEVAEIETLIAHVRAGHGWTFAPRQMSRRFAPLVHVGIRGFSAPYRVARIWRRNDNRPLVRTVLNLLCEMPADHGDPVPVGPSPAVARPAGPAGAWIPLGRIELYQIRSFAAVAEYGTLGRAAQSLRISQPGLSRQMRQLETDVGARLFERGARGVELTAAGETLRREIAKILASLDRLHNEVRRAERGRSGECILGVVPHAQVDRIVSETFRRLGSREARVRIGARSLTTPQLADALQKSEIDVAIAYAYPVPVAQMDGLMRHTLFTDEICGALVSETHALAGHASLSLAEISRETFLFPRPAVVPRLYEAVLQQFSAAGVTPRVEADYDSVLTIWSVIAKGAGWSLGTNMQITEPPAGTRCVPLRDFYLPWGGEVVYRADEARMSVLSLIANIMAAARGPRAARGHLSHEALASGR